MKQSDLQKTITVVGSCASLTAATSSTLALAANGVVSAFTSFPINPSVVSSVGLGAAVVGAVASYLARNWIERKAKEAAEEMRAW